MLFSTDQQTLDDLNIFGKHGGDSVYQIYNRTTTSGGALLLKELFTYPLSDGPSINSRSGIINYFAATGLNFPLKSSYLDAIEPYLANTDERTKLSQQEHSISSKLSNLIAMDAQVSALVQGVGALVKLLRNLDTFISALKIDPGHPYQPDKDAMAGLLAAPAFAAVVNPIKQGKPTATEIAEYDLLFRFQYREDILKLLRCIYHLDVYCAVAKVARDRGFVFPKAIPGHTCQMYLSDVYHPQVKQAVPNSIEISPERNVVFLTGANMAGKSTFMKSLSLALFLAHMGFPVPASKMEFSVLDGIYTSINLPDNLGMGSSHFYAEVLRVKQLAEKLKTRKLFVLFDELFRGTNVKDAAEATIALTEAFAGKNDSIFVISTHITEAAEVLKARCKNISFLYLPTQITGNQPAYTYKLEQGITADRHGMVIINNENILGILDQGKAGENQKDPGFITDKQTLSDLNLLGKYKPHSIYSLFNKVRTAGGERLLQEMFQSPFTDPEQINQRSAKFQFFHENQFGFSFDSQRFEQMQSYLATGISTNFVTAATVMLYHKFSASFMRDEQYNTLHAGLLATMGVLNSFSEFLHRAEVAGEDSPYGSERKALSEIFADPRLKWLVTERNTKNFSFAAFAKYDYLLKCTLQPQIEHLLKGMHLADVYLAVSNVARVNGFTYARAYPAGESVMRIDGLRHPGLAKGVANAVSLNDQNLLFLTGANMAGKSTFMKAFGVAVYLSHMGFPVAAREMSFSVLDGLYSSINVADDLNMGHSHFYAEVLRVKHVAREVASGKNLAVLFDELFKGTNVKDAYDGTLSVTAAFAKYRNCCYIVSTHIIEVGEALLGKVSNIQFAYLPTIMQGNIPKYTYKLKDGITSDRQGMLIIENEGIMDLIQS